MPYRSSDPSPGIFICYRTEDSSGHAGRLFDNLASRFGKDRIFMDFDKLEGGEDFETAIEQAVGSCEILLAIIGRHWLTVSEGASRKLENPKDFVRLEIVKALDRNIRVIPVLVQGAAMPKPEDLPDDLVKLTRRHALRLDDGKSWHDDVDELIRTIEKIFSERAETDRSKKIKLALVMVGAVVVFTVGFGLWKWSRSPEIKIDGPTPEPCIVTATGPTSVNGRAMRNILGMEFVLIPKGKFKMGSLEGELNSREEEYRQHDVNINYSFYMGKYEVNQAQWQTLMCKKPSQFKDCGDNCPVENVSWGDVQDFIKRLNNLGGEFTYRLPTEAEWEYACRAGTPPKDPGRDNRNSDDSDKRDAKAQAWFSQNSALTTHPVGQKQPNNWDLHDMRGNVWEWCEDLRHDNYEGAPRDGSAWLQGDPYRVLRGGSFDSAMSLTRPAQRLWESPEHRDKNKGFRLVAEQRTR
ncbi:MAG: SUMF1/EgtB/PvdO family nonheme iron enzyme [Pyrinomonadaceae bacterium]